jgi:hypothetical protein
MTKMVRQRKKESFLSPTFTYIDSCELKKTEFVCPRVDFNISFKSILLGVNADDGYTKNRGDGNSITLVFFLYLEGVVPPVDMVFIHISDCQISIAYPAVTGEAARLSAVDIELSSIARAREL